jgi:hypothetical protein
LPADEGPVRVVGRRLPVVASWWLIAKGRVAVVRSIDSDSLTEGLHGSFNSSVRAAAP